jgi:ABC-type transport system involved in multi-copper enzyme maturation permease subunit
MRVRRRRAVHADDGQAVPVRALPWLMKPVAWLSPLASALGADPSVFRAILEARLRIDLRQGGFRSNRRSRRGGLALTCLLYLVAGAVTGAAAFGVPDAFLYVSLVQALVMTMLAMALVTDFINLLMHPADADVLATRPVTDRTLLLARVVHVGLYLGLLIGSFSLGPWLLGGLAQGAPAWWIAFPLSALLAALLAFTVILAVFLAALRVCSAERVRGLILGAQVLMTIVIVGGYQLAAAALENEGLRTWLSEEKPAMLALPPFWFGGLTAAMLSEASPLRLALSAAAVAVPTLLAVAVARLAGRGFVTGLVALGRSESTGVAVGRPGPLRRLGHLLVAPGVERAGFDLFLGMAHRDRQFRMRVYPMLVLPIVFLLAFAVRASHGGRGGNLWLWGSYLPAVYSFSILMQLRFSDTPRARWIFAATPIEHHGLLLSGVVKALCFCFLLPWLLVVLGLASILSGKAALGDALFGSLVVVTATLWGAGRLARQALPFSVEFTTIDSTANVRVAILGMTLIGLAVGLHTALQGQTLLMAALAVPLVVLMAWLSRRLRQLKVDLSSLEE